MSSEFEPLGPEAQLSQGTYDELRRIASAWMKRERVEHTLQATALVHEAYSRLADRWPPDSDAGSVRAAMARTMRQVLVDHARRRGAQKRGGGAERLSLSINELSADSGSDLLLVDELLKRLAELGTRRAQVVELRVFGGLTREEICRCLGVARSTVDEDWIVARAWLAAALEESDS